MKCDLCYKKENLGETTIYFVLEQNLEIQTKVN